MSVLTESVAFRRAAGALTRVAVAAALAASLTGCGTTRQSHTKRTASEQLLVSDAIDRSVDHLDFSVLAGKDVYFDSQYIKDQVDNNYLVSSIRQKLLAAGCVLKEARAEATYIVEIRSGGIGTDGHEVVFGIPAVNVPPALAAMGGAPVGIPSMPELPLIKRTDQRAVTKLGVFAYNRETGRAVWQSGVHPITSRATDTWILGAGPFQRGTIYDGTKFAGGGLPVPHLPLEDRIPEEIAVTQPARFNEAVAEQLGDVQLAGHEEPVKPPAKPADAQPPAKKKPAPPVEKPAPPTEETAAKEKKPATAAKSPPPAAEKPAEKKQPAPPVEKPAAEPPPAANPPAEDSPAEDSPAEDSPAEDSPAAKAPSPTKPVGVPPAAAADFDILLPPEALPPTARDALPIQWAPR